MIELGILTGILVPLIMVGVTGLEVIGGLLKKEPEVPTIAPVDVTEEQRKALAGNIKNYGLTQELADLVNKSALSTRLAQMDTFLGKGTREQIINTIQSGLRGEIPGDVQNLIARKAAERGQVGGVAGSQFSRNLELRDLGLTSLARTEQALNAAERWMQVSQSGIQQFDFGSMFVSPMAAIQQANINRETQFQRDWMKNQIAAAYDPMTILGESLINFDAFIGEIGTEIAGAYFGGMGGGAGGMMGGGG